MSAQYKFDIYVIYSAQQNPSIKVYDRQQTLIITVNDPLFFLSLSLSLSLTKVRKAKHSYNLNLTRVLSRGLLKSKSGETKR